MKDPLGVSGGVFSNVVNLSLSPREVFLDFGLATPEVNGETNVNLMSRIILTKEHALELRDVLAKTLKVYEG